MRCDYSIISMLFNLPNTMQYTLSGRPKLHFIQENKQLDIFSVISLFAVRHICTFLNMARCPGVSPGCTDLESVRSIRSAPHIITGPLLPALRQSLFQDYHKLRILQAFFLHFRLRSMELPDSHTMLFRTNRLSLTILPRL